jgi:hypothetical protein
MDATSSTRSSIRLSVTVPPVLLRRVGSDGGEGIFGSGAEVNCEDGPSEGGGRDDDDDGAAAAAAWDDVGAFVATALKSAS